MEEWLLKQNPADFNFTVLAFVVVVAGIIFVFARWWPWYSIRADKAQAARLDIEQKKAESELVEEHRQNEIMASIRDTLTELRVLVSQQGRALEQLMRPDSKGE